VRDRATLCWCALLSFVACVCLPPGPARATAAPEQLFSQAGAAMGTTFTVYLYSNDPMQASACLDAAFEEIERVEEALSNYRPTSELSRINRDAAKEDVTTDPEVFHFLEI
jgi:thiamine biosynthesis lipoprotein